MRRRYLSIFVLVVGCLGAGYALSHLVKRRHLIVVRAPSKEAGCEVRWGIDMTSAWSQQPSGFASGGEKLACPERIEVSPDLAVQCECP
jgi:hypothetical protein